MVIKKMSEMIDSDQNRTNTTPESGTSPLPTAGVEETDTAPFNNNNVENSHAHLHSVYPDGENNVDLEVSFICCIFYLWHNVHHLDFLFSSDPYHMLSFTGYILIIR